ncbi:unnamed protein product [Chrysoparadoxa australica]
MFDGRPSSGQRKVKGGRQLATRLPVSASFPLTSVDTYRDVYGARRSWWGDLSPKDTRHLYHDLLPRSLQFVGPTNSVDDLEERARLASRARHAARLYARERCALPSRVAAHLYDGFRHFQKYGTWRGSGMTWEEIWDKYEYQVRGEFPSADDDEVRERTCRIILAKSCCTNPMFDKLAGLSAAQVSNLPSILKLSWGEILKCFDCLPPQVQQQHREKEELLRLITVLGKKRLATARRRVRKHSVMLDALPLRTL